MLRILYTQLYIYHRTNGLGWVRYASSRQTYGDYILNVHVLGPPYSLQDLVSPDSYHLIIRLLVQQGVLCTCTSLLRVRSEIVCETCELLLSLAPQASKIRTIQVLVDFM